MAWACKKNVWPNKFKQTTIELRLSWFLFVCLRRTPQYLPLARLGRAIPPFPPFSAPAARQFSTFPFYSLPWRACGASFFLHFLCFCLGAPAARLAAGATTSRPSAAAATAADVLKFFSEPEVGVLANFWNFIIIR